MKTEIITNSGMEIERPWWSVRVSLMAILALVVAVLVTMLTPTPLNAWVFGGDGLRQLANR